MLVIEDQAHYDAVVAFAKKIDLYDSSRGPDSLETQLGHLAKFCPDQEDSTRARLFSDGAPYSFYFILERKDREGNWKRWINGGLLFHGSHDGHGDGSGPTFAVSLTRVSGWSMHT